MSSSVLSYVDFVRVGYPKRVEMKLLYDAYFPKCYNNQEAERLTEPEKFCTTLLLSIGFKLNEFKFGMTQIFFRSSCCDLLNKLLTFNPAYINECGKKFKEFVIANAKKLIAEENIFETYSEEALDLGSTLELPVPETNVKNIPDTAVIGAAQMEISCAEVPSTKDRKKQTKIIGSKCTKRNSNETEKNPAQGKQKKTKSEKRPPNTLRYDTREHIPDFDEYENATRCKYEGCSFKTHVFCLKCAVHLCFLPERNCFKNFHNLNN